MIRDAEESIVTRWRSFMGHVACSLDVVITGPASGGLNRVKMRWSSVHSINSGDFKVK